MTLADGGDCLSDLQVLRNQPGLFGEVASQTTAWRVVEAIEQSVLERVQRARARARARVWKWGAAPRRVTLDFDATLVKSYSEKAGAAPTYKQGFGFHPLLVHLDETREALAGRLRPGNAGANTAQDHVELLEEALAQLPLPTRKEDPEWGLEVLVRADTTGATHGFVEEITARGLEFSIGFDVTEPVRLAILKLPKSAWVDAIQQDLEPREGAWVAELTPCLDLSAWPAGTRAIGRREEPHPGVQFNLFDPDGYRHQVLITNSPDLDIAYLEARHRGHARVEDRIRWGKALGLENFPFSKFSSNSVWLMAVMLAQDLLVWASISAWRVHWPRPSPSGCATRSGTPRDDWCAPPGG